MGGVSSSLSISDFSPFRDSAGHLAGKTIYVEGQQYKLQRKLGSGGFGAVYAAKGPHQDVAIKVIDFNALREHRQALADSYLVEIQHLLRLRQESRHVVHIYGFNFDDETGRGYIVMELGDESLASLIKRLHKSNERSRRGEYIDPFIRQQIWGQLVNIVKTLTSNNIVHMDLKPENIVLFGDTFKIIDLGISKKSDVQGQAGVGTPYYSAPEIMRPRTYRDQYYGPKADVWSLGAILYYMTYGTAPDYSSRAADPPNGVPPTHDRDLIDILRHTLVEDPHGRIDINSILRHPYTLRSKRNPVRHR